jgi:hypothetical protein
LCSTRARSSTRWRPAMMCPLCSWRRSRQSSTAAVVCSAVHLRPCVPSTSSTWGERSRGSLYPP